MTDAVTGLPIAGATVSITRNGYTLTQATGAAGQYSFVAGAGTYEVKAEAFGYAAQTVTGWRQPERDHHARFRPERPDDGQHLRRRAGECRPAERPADARPGRDPGVPAVSAGLSATAAADGTYHLADVPFGLQTVRLRAPGYAPLTQDIDVNGAMTLDFAPAPSRIMRSTPAAAVAPARWRTPGSMPSMGPTSQPAWGTTLGLRSLPAPFTFYGGGLLDSVHRLQRPALLWGGLRDING